MENQKEMRLQLYLAKAGIGSRRKCEEYILEGKVKVNGQFITEMGVKVTDDDQVMFNNKIVKPDTNYKYILLNKPARTLCSNVSQDEKPLAIDLISPSLKKGLKSVGRLDFLSSGLIIFTNDGDFSYKLTHPSMGIEKEYLVETARDIDEEFLKKLKKGFKINGINYSIQEYNLKAPKRVTLTLKEGKNREIRNIFDFLKIKIKKLHRIRIGNITISGMRPGEYKLLTKKDLSKLIGE